MLTLTPKQVKGICKNLGITPHFHKAVCIERIIQHQATVKPAQPKTTTCKDCPYFTSHNDGSDRGWCECFNHSAREGHHETQDCINQYWEADTVEESDQATEPTAVATPSQREVIEMCQEFLRAREWHTAQSELEQLIEEKAEEIAPESVIKHAENVYRVLSSEGTHRYQVNTYKGTCTCPAGSWYRPCRHIELAKDKQRQETESQMINKLPSGWREKQVVHSTPTGTQ